MQYELERDKSGPTGEPSLAEMTKKAVQILEKDTLGYFLLVEGRHVKLVSQSKLDANMYSYI